MLGYWAPWFRPWPTNWLPGFTLDYHAAVDQLGNHWNWSWCVWIDSLPWSQTCFTTMNLSCDLYSWLGMVTISGRALLALLRYCGAGPWLLRLALLCSAPSLLSLRDADQCCSMMLTSVQFVCSLEYTFLSIHYAVINNYISFLSFLPLFLFRFPTDSWFALPFIPFFSRCY